MECNQLQGKITGGFSYKRVDGGASVELEIGATPHDFGHAIATVIRAYIEKYLEHARSENVPMRLEEVHAEVSGGILCDMIASANHHEASRPHRVN
jgi:hypothetical protein